MFDVGADLVVHPVVVISDDAAGVVAGWVGDGGDGAVSAVAGDDTTVEQVCRSVAGLDDVVAVTGPAAAGYDHARR